MPMAPTLIFSLAPKILEAALAVPGKELIIPVPAATAALLFMKSRRFIASVLAKPKLTKYP
jgi:hypothetical protein